MVKKLFDVICNAYIIKDVLVCESQQLMNY